MSKYLSRIVNSIEPYVPGEQPKDKNLIKLNTNENPYPPSPKVLDAITSAVGEKLKLYPEPNCEKLRGTIADYYGLKKEQIFAGNGSDEVLAFAFRAFFDPGSRIIFPALTYSFYPVYCKLFEIEYSNADMTIDYNIDTEQLVGRNCGIVLANPNAPTGTIIDLGTIEQIVKSNIDNVVIVDEAYIDFGGETCIPLIKKYPNLLVIQTLSKSRSLAGIRVGFALGDIGLIEGLVKVKNSVNSYTLDMLAMEGAAASFEDEEYFKQTTSFVISTRERCKEWLIDNGFFVTESKANFLFAKHPVQKGEYLQSALREQGILVRRFNIPEIEDFLRISIGTDDDMNRFIDIMKNLI